MVPKRVEVKPKTLEDAEIARIAEDVLNWRLEQQYQARFALRRPEVWLTQTYDPNHFPVFSPEDPGPDPSPTRGSGVG
jgi:hypothetical protein